MLGLIDPAVIGGTLAVVLFVGIIAALAAGRWIGKRTIARYGPSAAPALGSLESLVALRRAPRANRRRGERHGHRVPPD
jgi:hypothetical protein